MCFQSMSLTGEIMRYLLTTTSKSLNSELLWQEVVNDLLQMLQDFRSMQRGVASMNEKKLQLQR